jgi:hypothetical protein
MKEISSTEGEDFSLVVSCSIWGFFPQEISTTSGRRVIKVNRSFISEDHNDGEKIGGRFLKEREIFTKKKGPFGAHLAENRKLVDEVRVAL